MSTHLALIDHLQLGRCCDGRSGRYCATGRELWLADKAQNVATYGRDGMAMIRENHPEWADEIKRRALILIEGEKRRAA